MKLISLTKTMPWLMAGGAILTLTASQKVSANTNNPATSVKQVQNTKSDQANLDTSNLRMVYLDTAAKIALGDLNLPLPASDGLAGNHENINAYLAKGISGSKEIDFTGGRSPKAFNDPTLQDSSGFPANDQSLFASFIENSFDTPEKAKQDVGYKSVDQQKADISTPISGTMGPGEIGSADLGNGISALTGLWADSRHNGFYTYKYYYYQGPYEIELSFYGSGDFDSNAQTKALTQAKADAAKLKGRKFATTDSHGLISYSGGSLTMKWQGGNNSYELSNEKGLNQALSMFASVK